MGRRKTGKFCAVPRREEGDNGGGRGLPPVHPLIFENIGDD